MENISKNITYAEGIHSSTAKRERIDNTPSPSQTECMKLLAEKIFQPLRKWVDGPIKINSFFRSAGLNDKIGGASSSQHCKGQAMDIDDVYGCKTNAEMYHYIKDNLVFDQLIWEFGDDKNPNWIHVSFVTHRENRRRLTVAAKKNGRTVYEHRSIEK